VPARSLNSIPVWAVRSAWSAPVAVIAVVLIWELAQMNFLAIRGRLGCARRALWLLAALLKAAVAVKRVALIWKLSRMNILTVRAI